MNTQMRKNNGSDVSVALLLDGPEYALWYDVGNMGMPGGNVHLQSAVGSYLCGRSSRIVKLNGDPLNEWEKKLVLVLARRYCFDIPDSAF